jgi:hypothetical protein
MASTYSTTLRLELIGNGDQSGTWGDTTNSNLGDLIEAAITNSVNITFADANYTLSANNGLPDEARNAVLNLIGTNTAQRNLVAPAVEKTYVIKNSTGANVAITAGGANVVIANGATQHVWCDGTNFYASTIAFGSGSTGTGSLVYSTSPTISSPTFTGTPVAPTAAVGTDTTQIATTAFVRDIIPTGIISLWSGSVASVPSGWYLCDGSNGTPDLRDRFVVGAGSTYAVAATGGSANATLVSHTHTATSVVTDPGHLHTFSARGDDGQGGSGAGTGVVGFDTNVGAGSGLMVSATTGVTVATTNSTEGSSATNANLPPYYALAYIMKA